MTDILNRVTSDAVKNATGKTWDEWLELLDEEKAETMSHKQIVNFLAGNNLVKNGWWQQQIAVGYEIARGKRVVGQTADAGFETGVQKTINIPLINAWELLTSPEGIKTWLGNTPRLNLRAREKFRTPDGTTGEIRSIDEGRKLRLTWVPRGWKQATTLQITLVPQGEKTSFRFYHERLMDERVRERMHSYWQDVLEQLEALAGS